MSSSSLLRSRLALLLLLASLSAAAGATETSTSPRPTMRRILAALDVLLPASLDEEGFRDPAQRPKILASLRALAESSAALEIHAGQRDPTFRNLSRSLGSDVAEALRSYRGGRFEEARFLVMEMTQNCVTCHSRLPSAGDVALAEALTNSVEVAALGRREKVNLLFATRQFEAALETWEAAFGDPHVAPLDLDVSGELTDYLTLCLRVKRDAGRARRGLAKLAARGDLPRYLRGRIRAWSSALEGLAAAGLDGSPANDVPSLERARSLVHRPGRFPVPHERLIYDLAASSELHRLLDAQPEPGPELAEAYFLLGAIETRSADSYWIPQAEFHLAAAVRLAPNGPFAEDAYELLETYAVANYGGTTEAWVPDAVRGRFEELQKLMEGSRGSAKQ